MTETTSGWNRRDLIGGAALLALVIGVPVATLSNMKLDGEEKASDRQRELIDQVVDLVIPRTGTPGARDVGVGAFVLLALEHGLSETRSPVASGMITAALAPFKRRDGSLRHLDWLERALDKAGNGDFFRRSHTERSEILAALDAAAFAQGAAWSPWVGLKGLILTGYYTSEVGGSRELRYELVPGRYDPDLPLAPVNRAWSSDWTAVEFG